MKVTTNIVAVLIVAAVISTGAARAQSMFNATISDVTMNQRPHSRLVDIGYTLANEAAIITLAIETNGVAIPDSAVTRLTGAVSTLIQPGTHTITWDAGADWPEHVTETARARVTAWSTNAPPLYCAIDVAAQTQTNYYPVYYYPSAEGVPGGVTNRLYKTVRILMRKLPPTGRDGFPMGSPSEEAYRTAESENLHVVVLTRAFYAGVYEVTQRQWQQVMSDVRSWPGAWTNVDYKATRPVEMVSYYDIRESTDNTDDPAVDWPANNVVAADSFMGRLRAKTGVAGFDLPTNAQWEYACRAGTTGALNDGTVNITNASSDARLDLLGRYARNGGKIGGTSDPERGCTTENATAEVGSYAPNAWGLYDMHGNVWEWCLDWSVLSLGYTEVTDPVGPSGPQLNRVVRGGGWDRDASFCRSAFLGQGLPNTRNYRFGFRVVRTLP